MFQINLINKGLNYYRLNQKYAVLICDCDKKLLATSKNNCFSHDFQSPKELDSHQYSNHFIEKEKEGIFAPVIGYAYLFIIDYILHMIKTRFRHVLILLFSIIMIGSSGCFLKKKKKRSSSFISNIVTKYNILYNSKYLLNQAQKNTQQSGTENYQQPISVFHTVDKNSANQNKVLGDSIVGKLNRIINEKQDSKYVSEAFLLKSKAYFFKGDFFNAIEFANYAYEDTASNVKIKAEAKLWQVRSLLALDNLKEAKNALNQARLIPFETNQLKSLFFATEAYYQLRNNQDATNALEEAIKFSNSKKDRMRWHYLLGQLYFQNGNDDRASAHFNQVIKSNESYEMIFYANLYGIELANKKNPSLENRVMLLTKLLRDGKNKDFKGQIYQRIGDAYFAEDQKEKGIVNYELATKNTVNNPYQEAINYEKLADIYFNDGEYTNASFYYDSTLMVLPKNNPSYDLLTRKHTFLDSLVKHLTVIKRQDSLIHFTKLGESERLSFVKQAAEEYYKTVESIKKKGVPKSRPSLGRNNAFENQRNEASDFYFSSQTAISQGLSAFKKRWGNRSSDGYWRYSNQSDNLINDESKITSVASIDSYSIDSYKTKEDYTENLHNYYLDLLLDSPEKQSAAIDEIKEATIYLGEIYQNNLHDFRAAIETYEDYLGRFPKDENTAMVLYHLYRLYTDQSGNDAATYRARLMSEYPNSVYSLVLNDPDYYKKQHDRLERFNKEYETAFNLFQSKKYQELFEHSAKITADKSFDQLESSLAQLAYLNALATGRTADVNAFELALKEIIEHYASDEIVVPLVKQHLEYIEANQNQFTNRSPALDEANANRTLFEKEFVITPWPELAINKDYANPQGRKEYVIDRVETTTSTIKPREEIIVSVVEKEISRPTTAIRHENSYNDLKLFPDSAKYLFVINVMHESVNLSPSRYGVGQFNRSHYRNANISHQLKIVEDEYQLVYIGLFNSYDEAKEYEKKISPLLITILKIPKDLYNSFIVTENIFDTFETSNQVDDYHTLYQTQP